MVQVALEALFETCRVRTSLARPICANKTIVPAREQSELGVTQELFVAGRESKAFEIDILAECLERLGVKATLLGGGDDTLHHRAKVSR